MNTREVQVGDVIEEYNLSGSSDRETLRTFQIISVTKTLAKSKNMRFSRIAEQWRDDSDYIVKYMEARRWSVYGYRLQIKKE
jgi:hypothetical protein